MTCNRAFTVLGMQSVDEYRNGDRARLVEWLSNADASNKFTGPRANVQNLALVFMGVS